MANSPKATIDFETRSACNLKRHGTWRYSVDSSTEVLCLVYRLPSWSAGRTEVWRPRMPVLGLDEYVNSESLEELLSWINDGGLVEAHNVWFEYCIWSNVLVSQYGWPPVPMSQWRCSAAKAAAHALPRNLADASGALHLPLSKDMDGHKLMLKMSKPRKSRKAERETALQTGVALPRYLWWESPEMLDRLITYCRQDVLTEEALSHALPDLNAAETKLFLLDLEMNERGFQLDKQAVSVALKLIHREGVILNQELTLLTDRKVKKATQRAKMLSWFQDNGLWIEDTKKETIDGLLTGDLTTLNPRVHSGLQLLRALGRSSTAKYQAMKDWMAVDGRVRGGLLYHGATTGRWSGKGVQPHNFPRGTQKINQQALWTALKAGSRDPIAQDYRSVMEALSNGLRGAITASKGAQLYVADFAQIEARVLLWLAGDTEHLDSFRQGRDIYCDTASEFYRRTITKADTQERSLFKVAVLGLGFGMGAPKFVTTCANQTPPVIVEEDVAKDIVEAYRTKFWKVKELWSDQQEAAIQAVRGDKKVIGDLVTWFVQKPFLYYRLPSGRCLAYPFPEIHMKETPWGEEQPGLTYMGVDTYSHKWKRQRSYGGLLVENVVQAIARDCMAEAMLRCNANGYPVVLSVHDEIVSESEGGSVHEFEQLVTELPRWAHGMPVAADAWQGFRYHK